jgi:hypothetical protein
MILVAVAIWIGSLFAVEFFPYDWFFLHVGNSLENRNFVGAAMNLSGVLISALAFAGLIYTVSLQRMQLRAALEEAKAGESERLQEKIEERWFLLLKLLPEIEVSGEPGDYQGVYLRGAVGRLQAAISDAKRMDPSALLDAEFCRQWSEVKDFSPRLVETFGALGELRTRSDANEQRFLDNSLAAFVTEEQVQQGTVEALAKGNTSALRLIRHSGLLNIFVENEFREFVETTIDTVLGALESCRSQP